MSDKHKLAEKMEMSEYYGQAKSLYDKYLAKNKRHIGVSRDDVFVVCLYLVSRINKIPRRYSFFDDFTDCKLSGLRNRIMSDLDLETKSFRLVNWFPRILEVAERELQFDDFESVAMDVVEFTERLEDEGRIYTESWFNCPRIAVVSLLYVSSILNGESISQHSVGEVFHVKELSIRKYYRNIVALLGIEKKRFEEKIRELMG